MSHITLTFIMAFDVILNNCAFPFINRKFCSAIPFPDPFSFSCKVLELLSLSTRSLIAFCKAPPWLVTRLLHVVRSSSLLVIDLIVISSSLSLSVSSSKRFISAIQIYSFESKWEYFMKLITVFFCHFISNNKIYSFESREWISRFSSMQFFRREPAEHIKLVSRNSK